ncbi:MAG TPA: VWA containing CoxE family protein [Bacillota bacterium]|nr:VWA containing CoxE family protein [Bacillota bacterium]
MFSDFFFELKRAGVPVSLTEWMTLMEALEKGLANASLTSFYYLARSILIKSETHFDHYDVAFQKYFAGLETPSQITDQIMQWLDKALPAPELLLDPDALLKYQVEGLDLVKLREMLEQRLREQNEEHNGGSHWIGTQGTSAFGHSGFHPGGIRVGGHSTQRTAVKVAGERQYRDFRTDETLDVRQFEIALRKLRQFTTRLDGPKDVLDLEGTIEATAANAGLLDLQWTRARKNSLRLILLMDSGGSMVPYYTLCNRLFTALNHSTHLKSLEIYYFHNCVYDRIYLDPICQPRNSINTAEFLHTHQQDHKLLVVGDASMAPSELTHIDGIIDWGYTNSETGLEWLQRLTRHFPHHAWLNPVPAEYWNYSFGSYTINLIRQVFPMFELTVDGLDLAVKKLKVRS